MAIDSLVDSAILNANLTLVADAIRSKTGTTKLLSFPDGMVDAISDISPGTNRLFNLFGDPIATALLPENTGFGLAWGTINPSIEIDEFGDRIIATKGSGNSGLVCRNIITFSGHIYYWQADYVFGEARTYPNVMVGVSRISDGVETLTDLFQRGKYVALGQYRRFYRFQGVNGYAVKQNLGSDIGGNHLIGMKNPLCLDLTETYGTGNEPSEAACALAFRDFTSSGHFISDVEFPFATLTCVLPHGWVCSASIAEDELDGLQVDTETIFGLTSAGSVSVRAESDAYSMSRIVEISEGIDYVLDLSAEVPDEFQVVQYLESHGSEYIDTGVSGVDGIELSFAYPSTPASGSVFGARGSDGGADRFSLTIWVGRFLVLPNDASIKATDTDVHTINFGAKDAWSGLFDDIAFSAGRHSPVNVSLYLFAEHLSYTSSVGFKSASRIYACKIYKGENVAGNLIPCYRKADDKPGMFDIVSGLFLTNKGTNEFAVGSDIV